MLELYSAPIVEGEGNQAGMGIDDLQAELTSDVIAETGCAHLGDRLATRGDHQGVAASCKAVSRGHETGRISGDAIHRTPQSERNAFIARFRNQHFNDLLRGSIAEELAQVSLVISNAMALDPSDEIVLGVAAESRDAVVRIFRQEVGGRAAPIGEVAAAAS